MGDALYDDPFGFIQVDPLTGQKNTVLPDYTPRPSPRREPTIFDHLGNMVRIAPTVARVGGRIALDNAQSDMNDLRNLPANIREAAGNLSRGFMFAGVALAGLAVVGMIAGRAR